MTVSESRVLITVCHCSWTSPCHDGMNGQPVTGQHGNLPVRILRLSMIRDSLQELWRANSKINPKQFKLWYSIVHHLRFLTMVHVWSAPYRKRCIRMNNVADFYRLRAASIHCICGIFDLSSVMCDTYGIDIQAGFSRRVAGADGTSYRFSHCTIHCVCSVL